MENQEWLSVVGTEKSGIMAPIGPMPKQYASKLLSQVLTVSPNTDTLIRYREVDEGLVLLNIIKPASRLVPRTTLDAPVWFHQEGP